MAGLRDFLLTIPPVTRFFLIALIALSMAVSLNVTFLLQMWFSPERVVDEVQMFLKLREVADVSTPRFVLSELLQCYRMFTLFFIVDGVLENGPMVLLNIYTFYTFSNYMENSRGRFRGNFADYVWFILVCGTFLVAINFAFTLAGLKCSFLNSQLQTSIVYVWLRSYMNTTINFLSVVPIKAYYLPLFDFAVAVISGKNHPTDFAAGVLAGYLYQCIQSDTLPIYNLLPGVYGRHLQQLLNGRRVGINVALVHDPNEFQPAIFDLGYWKAPAFFYRLLKYPTNTSERTTAFTKPPVVSRIHTKEVRATGYEHETTPTFRGKGHRLGS